MSNCKNFCNRLLREARVDAKRYPQVLTQIKGWYVDRSGQFGKRYFWVKVNSGRGEAFTRKTLWEGSACCTYHAKFNTLMALIEKAERTPPKYKIGDRVKCKDDVDRSLKGTICALPTDAAKDDYLVDLDNKWGKGAFAETELTLIDTTSLLSKTLGKMLLT